MAACDRTNVAGAVQSNPFGAKGRAAPLKQQHSQNCGNQMRNYGLEHSEQKVSDHVCFLQKVARLT